jgi:hypothetical protein
MPSDTGAPGGLISAEDRKSCSLPPFRYEAASGFPVDFGAPLVLGERPPHLKLCHHPAINEDEDRYPNVTGTAYKLD